MSNQDSKATVHKSSLNSELVIKEKLIYKENYAPFTMIGEINRDKGRNKMDIFDKLFTLSKGAFRVFIKIKIHSTGEYNLAFLHDLDCLNENQMKVFRRCIAELRKASLVVRAKNRDPQVKVSRHTYMINPSYLKCMNYSKAKDLWSLYNH
jgi:hypothetical protein